MTFDITGKHPAYDVWAPTWQTMRDAIGGEDDVKRAGTRYLPMKSAQAAMTNPQLRNESYAAYQTRAGFPEIVAPTIVGQVGLINSQPPSVNLPARMEPIIEKATLSGLTLADMISKVTVEILSTGRYGLLPTFDAAGVPYIATYAAESIINWDHTSQALDYVVLDESGLVRDRKTNAWSLVKQYRELRIADGFFESVEWTEAGSTIVSGAPQRSRMSATAERFVNFMPFVVIGTRNLEIDPDDAPLYGLARTAIRMYRLDADYQQSLHMTSEPTPWVSGYGDAAKAQATGRVPTSIGSASMWVLPEGGRCGFLEFSGAGLAAQRGAIDAEREVAATHGARMFDETSRAPESGESRKIRYGHTTASLKTIAKTVCAGVERALKNQAIWMGLNPADVSVVPNLDWVTDRMSEAELNAMVKTWQAGAISFETLFDQMKVGKIVDQDRTVEEEVAAILSDPLRDAIAPELDPADPESGLVPPGLGGSAQA